MSEANEPKVVPIHPDLDFDIHLHHNKRYIKTRLDGRHGYTVGDEVGLYLALKRTIARVHELEAQLAIADKPAAAAKAKK